MGRRWKKYIASLTLCQRFSTGKFLAMWNAVFREEVDLGWVAAFGEVLTLSSQAVGRMMAEAIKRQWRTKSVLQYGQLKLSTKKQKLVRNVCKAKLQFTVWDSGTPETPKTPGLPRLPRLRDSQDSGTPKTPGRQMEIVKANSCKFHNSPNHFQVQIQA